MDLTNEIFEYLSDGNSTLVFPTENTARFYLSRYVREKRTSILATRAIAFDQFKLRFSPRHSGLRPADKYHRLAFVTSFLDGGDTALTYLYRDSLHSYYSRFVPFMARILPMLVDLDQSRIGNRNLLNDLVLLRRAYGTYLSEHGLFEPAWERPSLSNCADKTERTYVLVGYDADIPMQALMDDLGEVPNIVKLCLKTVGDAGYERFLTEEGELEALFHRLERLKLEGVSTEDIILSTPNLNALQSRLDRKAAEYNIPISYVKQLKLAETVPGRYLFAVRRCINENLSFASLENLLLNTSLPFSDRERCRSLIDFMIAHNVQSGSLEYRSDDLFAELSFEARKEGGDAGLKDFYMALKSAIGAIRSASDGDEVIKDIHGLTFFLLGQDEFNQGNDTDRDVYSFIFSELSMISATLKESGLRMNDIFSIFMGQVEELSYVTQEKRTGIRVYSYGQDHLLDAPYHFLFGLNDSNSRVRQSALSFLEDHEVQSRRTCDVTDSILSYYRSVGEHIYITGSETSYSGAQSVPAYFIKDNLIFDSRESLERVVEKADSESFNYASQTFFSGKGTDLSLSIDASEAVDENVRLSYSAISSYAGCPYMSFLGRTITRDAPPSLKPASQDDSAIGSFLHEIVQSFMSRHFGQTLSPEHLDEYHEEMQSIMDDCLANDHQFDFYTKESIRGIYLQSLKDIVTILLSSGRRKGSVGPFTPISNEFRLEHNDGFIGFIDTIIQTNDGDLYLLDYKKGSGDATYQLVLYKRLYEEEPQSRGEVRDCLFYSMKNSRFNGFDQGRWEEQSLKLDQDLERIRKGYRAGDWVATPSKENCRFCKERSICRRRFNLQ